MAKCERGTVQQTTQRERFIETARALGCDEDEAAFDAQLRVIAAHRPEKDEKPPTKPRGKKGSAA